MNHFMLPKKHHVTIKGTKDGLSFHLDDNCSLHSLFEELEEKLSSKHYQKDQGQQVQVNVTVGNRYLTKEQEDRLRDIIISGKNLVIEKIHSNVLLKEDAEAICREQQVISMAKIIRSGQVLEITGDLLLVGDVNPGGTVAATGNIYILGALRGIAHAGRNGDKQAIVAASLMAPSQLKIADYFRQDFPKHMEDSEVPLMECAYIDETINQIQLERLQHVQKLRPNLGQFPEKILV